MVSNEFVEPSADSTDEALFMCGMLRSHRGTEMSEHKSAKRPNHESSQFPRPRPELSADRVRKDAVIPDVAPPMSTAPPTTTITHPPRRPFQATTVSPPISPLSSRDVGPRRAAAPT